MILSGRVSGRARRETQHRELNATGASDSVKPGGNAAENRTASSARLNERKGRVMTKLGVGIQDTGPGITAGTEAFEALIGRKVDATRHYRNFNDRLDDSTIIQSIAGGRSPLISWHAFTGLNGTDARWADITAGLHDDVIALRAAELISLGTAPVRFVFHHEPEDDVDSIGGQGKCGVAADFAPAWRHVKRTMRAAGVGLNVRFGVCLMGATYRGGHGGPAAWIPSTLKPDFIASDGYNRTVGAWASFDEVFGPAHTFAVSRGKPFVIEECGCSEGPTPDLKPAWYADAARVLAVWKPELLMYSNVYAANFGGQDYRIDTSPASLAAFKALVGTL